MKAEEETRSTARPVRVVVVDADRRVRQSLCGFIGLGAPIDVVGSAGDPAGALGCIEREKPQVVLVDPRLPDLDTGRALLGTLHARWPEIRVVIMGGADRLDSPGLDDVAGHLARSAEPGDFVDAILAAGDPGTDPKRSAE